MASCTDTLALRTHPCCAVTTGTASNPFTHLSTLARVHTSTQVTRLSGHTPMDAHIPTHAPSISPCSMHKHTQRNTHSLLSVSAPVTQSPAPLHSHSPHTHGHLQPSSSPPSPLLLQTGAETRSLHTHPQPPHTLCPLTPTAHPPQITPPRHPKPRPPALAVTPISPPRPRCPTPRAPGPC